MKSQRNHSALLAVRDYVLKISFGNGRTGGALNKENVQPQRQLYGLPGVADDSSSEDAAQWVYSRLEMLDLTVKRSELTPNVTRCIQQLLMEVR